MSLTFDVLRAANIARQEEVEKFRNSDWKLSAWSNAVLGELGEAANIIKKMERKDFDSDPVKMAEAKAKLADELADVQCYLDILARKAGVNLGEATISKWNEVSCRSEVNFSRRLAADGLHSWGD